MAAQASAKPGGAGTMMVCVDWAATRLDAGLAAAARLAVTRPDVVRLVDGRLAVTRPDVVLDVEPDLVTWLVELFGLVPVRFSETFV